MVKSSNNSIYRKFIDKFNLKRYYVVETFTNCDWGGSYTDYDIFTIYDEQTFVSRQIYNKYFKIRNKKNLELFKKEFEEALKAEKLEIEYQELSRKIIKNFNIELLEVCRKYLDSTILNSDNDLDIEIMRNILEIKDDGIIEDVQEVFEEWLKIKR